MGAAIPLWAKRTEEFLPEIQAADQQDQVKWVLAGCRKEFLYGIRDALRLGGAPGTEEAIRHLGTPCNAAEWFALKAACDRLGLTDWYRRKQALDAAGLVDGAEAPTLFIPDNPRRPS